MPVAATDTAMKNRMGISSSFAVKLIIQGLLIVYYVTDHVSHTPVFLYRFLYFCIFLYLNLYNYVTFIYLFVDLFKVFLCKWLMWDFFFHFVVCNHLLANIKT